MVVLGRKLGPKVTERVQADGKQSGEKNTASVGMTCCKMMSTREEVRRRDAIAR